MNRINRRGVSRAMSWAMALGLAASSVGCVGNSLGAQSAAAEPGNSDRHFVRDGRELRELGAAEAMAAEPGNSDRHFVREGRELSEVQASASDHSESQVHGPGFETNSRTYDGR
jgi:hypothetical protein